MPSGRRAFGLGPGSGTSLQNVPASFRVCEARARAKLTGSLPSLLAFEFQFLCPWIVISATRLGALAPIGRFSALIGRQVFKICAGRPNCVLGAFSFQACYWPINSRFQHSWILNSVKNLYSSLKTWKYGKYQWTMRGGACLSMSAGHYVDIMTCT